MLKKLPLIFFALIILFTNCSKIEDPKIPLDEVLSKTRINMKNVYLFSFREKSESEWPGEYKRKMIEDVKGNVDLKKYIKHDINECTFENFFQQGQKINVVYENYTTLNKQYTKKENAWKINNVNLNKNNFSSLIDIDFLKKIDAFKEVVKSNKKNHYYLHSNPSIDEIWNFFIFGNIFKKDESSGIHEIASIDAVVWISRDFFLQKIKLVLKFENSKGQIGKFTTEYSFYDYNIDKKITLPGDTISH